MITTIQLPDFRGYTRESLEEFFTLAPTRFFEIVLPKTSDMDSMGARAILEDFTVALHLSQSLQSICPDMICMATPWKEPGVFSILLLTVQLQELAAILEPYVNGFDPEGRPGWSLLNMAEDMAPIEGEAIASAYYYEVYRALKDSNCSPYALENY